MQLAPNIFRLGNKYSLFSSAFSHLRLDRSTPAYTNPTPNVILLRKTSNICCPTEICLEQAAFGAGKTIKHVSGHFRWHDPRINEFTPKSRSQFMLEKCMFAIVDISDSMTQTTVYRKSGP